MIGDKPAAAVHLLHNGGSPVTTGTTVLTSSDREDLAAGRLTLRIYTKRNARGMNVRLPGRR